jgi:hypothetical protein
MVTAAAAASNRSLQRGGGAERTAAVRRRQVDRINAAAATGARAQTSPSALGTSSSMASKSATAAGKPEADSGPKSCAFFWSQFHDFERRLEAESYFGQQNTVDGNNNKSEVYVEDDDDVFSSTEVAIVPASAPPSLRYQRSPMVSDALLTERRQNSDGPVNWRSLMFSETSSVPSVSGTHQLQRSTSMPSEAALSAAGGRRKSEVLYFSYAESKINNFDV